MAEGWLTPTLHVISWVGRQSLAASGVRGRAGGRGGEEPWFSWTYMGQSTQSGRLWMDRKPAIPSRELENGLCVSHNKKAFLPSPRGRKWPVRPLPQPERRLCWWPWGLRCLECVGREGQGGQGPHLCPIPAAAPGWSGVLGCCEVGPSRF